jgi:hypothetical protein
MTELRRLLWAKSAKKDTPDNEKPVLAHLPDVAACAWEPPLEPESTRNRYTLVARRPTRAGTPPCAGRVR